jgi:uncharacterized protein
VSILVNDVCRSVRFTAAGDTDVPGDGLTLEGHAAVFGQETRIDSWEGTFVETIRKGAFRKTIRERTPVMQFDHGRHPLVGSLPIGRIEDLREDDEGLYVRGRITDNWLIQPVRDAIAERTVNGMSFRFEVMRQEWRDAQGKVLKDPDEINRLLWDPGDRGPLRRDLIELRVPELGPVVFPAYEGTAVSVRASDVAAHIRGSEGLRREVQRALASDVAVLPERVLDLPTDEEVRGQIARDLLFNQTSASAPPENEHPDADSEPGDEVRDSSDAPPTEGHPSVPDAPPDQGHPSSQSARELRRKYARLAYVTREGVGKKYTNGNRSTRP